MKLPNKQEDFTGATIEELTYKTKTKNKLLELLLKSTALYRRL